MRAFGKRARRLCMPVLGGREREEESLVRTLPQPSSLDVGGSGDGAKGMDRALAAPAVLNGIISSTPAATVHPSRVG